MNSWAGGAAVSNANDVEMDNFNNFNPYFSNGLATHQVAGGSGDFQMANFSMGNNFPLIDPSIQALANEGTFLGANDDLNSFFPTPNREVGAFGDPMEMFDQQGFPFPQQVTQLPIPASSTLNPNWIAPNAVQQTIEVSSSTNTTEEQPDSPEELPKPKRGRPRKRKRKEPPTEEEELQKRSAFLERNRRAASKCRKRKKESNQEIQEKASILEKQVNFLRVQLANERAFYEQCLGLATSVAAACPCPDSDKLQAYLKSAEQRGILPLGANNTIVSVPMAVEQDALSPADSNDYADLFPDSGSLVMMSREQSQDSSQSHQSIYPTLNGLQLVDIKSDGNQSMALNSPRESAQQQFSGMERLHLETALGMSRQPSHASSHSASMSRQPPIASPHPVSGSPVSAVMSRHPSYSSTGQTSNKDSGYGSNRTTPKDRQPLSPVDVGPNPQMMRNPRVPKNVASPQQLQSRQLRSGNSKSTGPADLDDPSVHIDRHAKR